MTDLDRGRGLWLHGISGRMGREIQKLFVENKAPGLRLVGGSARTFEGDPFYLGRTTTPTLLANALERDDVEIVLDFSSAAGNQLLLESFKSSQLRRKALVIGSTGMGAHDQKLWRELAQQRELRLLFAPNTSIGILMAVKAALLVAPTLKGLGFDIEITETHHRNKQDAPSGTARFLAESIVSGVDGLKIVTDRHGARLEHELGVHAVRGGGVFGEHEIRLIGDSEELCISHRAFSRSLFAAGAIVLVNWLVTKSPGIYGLLDVDLREII
ncbi:MAG: 4-hydroxy-tetrahydrodipicolinate reductase [Proteobacteria bacterium]|nr:4-hydroxy-tetrahydrodipicolinate reductase [Pseudomonadota bacterium]